MIFTKSRDGAWNADYGQSGAGFHLMLWYQHSDEKGTFHHWRVTCEVDGSDALYERRGDGSHCSHLMVFLKEKIHHGLLTMPMLEEHLDLVVSLDHLPGFGRFA